MCESLERKLDRLVLALSRTSFFVTAFLKAVARDVLLNMVIDLENYWSILMRTVGKGHDKTHYSRDRVSTILIQVGNAKSMPLKNTCECLLTRSAIPKN
jgi:hypothetical protein